MATSNEGVPEIDRLRNNIEFASVSQFFHTFQSAFRPWPTADRHSSPYPQLLQPRKNKQEEEDHEFQTEVKRSDDRYDNYRADTHIATILGLTRRIGPGTHDP